MYIKYLNELEFNTTIIQQIKIKSVDWFYILFKI